MHNSTANQDKINQDTAVADGATPPTPRHGRNAAQDAWTRAMRLADPNHPENRRRRNFWQAANNPKVQARVRKLALSRPNPLNF